MKNVKSLWAVFAVLIHNQLIIVHSKNKPACCLIIVLTNNVLSVLYIFNSAIKTGLLKLAKNHLFKN